MLPAVTALVHPGMPMRVHSYRSQPRVVTPVFSAAAPLPPDGALQALDSASEAVVSWYDSGVRLRPLEPSDRAAHLGEVADAASDYKVLYDGLCMICVTNKRVLTRFDKILRWFNRKQLKLQFVDIRSASYDPARNHGILYEDAMRLMHVRQPEPPRTLPRPVLTFFHARTRAAARPCLSSRLGAAASSLSCTAPYR